MSRNLINCEKKLKEDYCTKLLSYFRCIEDSFLCLKLSHHENAFLIFHSTFVCMKKP